MSGISVKIREIPWEKSCRGKLPKNLLVNYVMLFIDEFCLLVF